MESLELTIIHNLLYNEEYFNKIIPFVKMSCFTDKAVKAFVAGILHFYINVHERPTPELVIPEVLSRKYNEDVFKQIRYFAKILGNPPTEQKINSLIASTEEYFRKVITEHTLAELVEKAGDNKKIELKDVMELRDAVSFGVDEKQYYDYLGTFEERVKKYVEKTDKFPLPLKALNDCTNGGMRRKSMSVVMASTGGGKSIFLCNAAGYLIKEGYNVLYVTCEMSVEEIAKRVDANLLNATQDSMTTGEIDEQTLKQRLSEYYPNRSNWGKLFLQEYPAGYATALNIQQDLEEIERSKGVKVDVLVVDYLNLMSTSRYSTKNANTYTIVKAIAEELRGIGQELDIPILTATQSNRSALSKENRVDGGLETVSDSIGLPQTADFMFNIIDVLDPEWKKYHWRLIKILKNRWGDPSKEYIKVKLDTAFARFSDVEGCLVGSSEKPILSIDADLTKIEGSDKVNKKAESKKSGSSKDEPVIQQQSAEYLF